MLAIIIEFEVRPECFAEFEARLCADAAQTREEDGCWRMEVWRVRGESHRLVLSELWRDEAALDAHRSRPGHSHAWQTPWIAGKRVISGELLASA